MSNSNPDVERRDTHFNQRVIRPTLIPLLFATFEQLRTGDLSQAALGLAIGWGLRLTLGEVSLYLRRGVETLERDRGFKALVSSDRDHYLKKIKGDRVYVRKDGARTHTRGILPFRREITLTPEDDTSTHRNVVLAHELAHLVENHPARAAFADSAYGALYASCLFVLLLAWSATLDSVWQTLLGTLNFTEPSLASVLAYRVALSISALLIMMTASSFQHEQHRNHEFLADKKAEKLTSRKELLDALPANETWQFPFSSHPHPDERKARIETQFGRAGEQRRNYALLILASASFLASSLVAALLFTQVQLIANDLNEVRRTLGFLKGSLKTRKVTDVGDAVRKLYDTATTAKDQLEGYDRKLGLAPHDGEAPAKVGLEALRSTAEALKNGLDSSSKPLILAMGSAANSLGIQHDGGLADAGTLPKLEDSLDEFTDRLDAVRDKKLGLPLEGKPAPPGTLMARLMNSTEQVSQRLEKVPGALGFSSDGGVVDGGAYQRITTSAGKVASTLEDAASSLELLNLSGKKATCTVALDHLRGKELRSAISKLPLTERLACMDELSKQIIDLQIQRLEEEENRRQGDCRLDGGSCDGGSASNGQNPAPPTGGDR